MTLALALAVLVVCALGLFWHDLIADLNQALEQADIDAEWDEVVGLDELYPRPALTLLNADRLTVEAMQTTKGKAS